jgi:hypothetical protein
MPTLLEQFYARQEPAQPQTTLLDQFYANMNAGEVPAAPALVPAPGAVTPAPQNQLGWQPAEPGILVKPTAPTQPPLETVHFLDQMTLPARQFAGGFEKAGFNAARFFLPFVQDARDFVAGGEAGWQKLADSAGVSVSPDWLARLTRATAHPEKYGFITPDVVADLNTNRAAVAQAGGIFRMANSLAESIPEVASLIAQIMSFNAITKVPAATGALVEGVGGALSIGERVAGMIEPAAYAYMTQGQELPERVHSALGILGYSAVGEMVNSMGLAGWKAVSAAYLSNTFLNSPNYVQAWKEAEAAGDGNFLTEFAVKAIPLSAMDLGFAWTVRGTPEAQRADLIRRYGAARDKAFKTPPDILEVMIEDLRQRELDTAMANVEKTPSRETVAKIYDVKPGQLQELGLGSQPEREAAVAVAKEKVNAESVRTGAETPSGPEAPGVVSGPEGRVPVQNIAENGVGAVNAEAQATQGEVAPVAPTPELPGEATPVSIPGTLEPSMGTVEGVPRVEPTIGLKGKVPPSPQVTVTERAGLALKLKAEAAGSRAGYTAGKLEATQAIRAEWRQRMADIKDAFRQKQIDQQAVREQVYKYSEAFLPLKERGRVTAILKNVKTDWQMATALARIDVMAENYNRNVAVTGIEKTAAKAWDRREVMLPEYRRATEMFLRRIFPKEAKRTFRFPLSEAVKVRRPGIEDFLKRAQQWASHFKPLDSMTTEQVNAANEWLKVIVASARIEKGTVNAERMSHIDTMSDNMAHDVLKGSVLEPPERPGARNLAPTGVRSRFYWMVNKKFPDWVRGQHWALLSSMHGALETIDGEPNGPMHRFFFGGLLQLNDAYESRANQDAGYLKDAAAKAGIQPHEANGRRRTVEGKEYVLRELLQTYLSSKDVGHEDHLRFGNKIEVDHAAAMVAALTPQERSWGDAILQWYNGNWERMSGAYYDQTGLELPRNVGENYVRIFLEREPTQAWTEILQEVQERAFDKYRKGTAKGQFRSRVPNADQPIRLDAIRNFFMASSQFAQAEHLGAFYQEAQAILNAKGGQLRKALVQKFGENAAQTLTEWIDRVSRVEPAKQLKGLDKFLGWLNAKTPEAALAGNIGTMIRMPVSLVNSIGYLEPGEAGGKNLSNHLAAAMYLAASPVTDGWAKAAEAMPWLVERQTEHTNGAKRVASDFNRSNKLTAARAKWVGKLMELTASGQVAVDRIGAMAHYMKALEAGMTPDQASQYAEQIISRTQSTGGPLWRPGAWNSELTRAFSMFQNETVKLYDMVFDHLPKQFKAGFRLPGAKGYADAFYRSAWQVAWSFGAGAFLLGIAGRGRTPTKQEYGKDLAALSLAPLWPVGPWVASVFVSSTPFLAPPQTFVESAGKAVKYGVHGKLGRAAEEAYKVGAMTAGLPAIQPARTVRGAYELATGKTHDIERLAYSEYSRRPSNWTPEAYTYIQGLDDPRRSQLMQEFTKRKGKVTLAMVKKWGVPQPIRNLKFPKIGAPT